MLRTQLLDFIVRVGFKSIVNCHGIKVMAHLYLQEFFDVFVLNVTKNSKIIIDRKTIRASKKLNELLFDN